MAMPIVSARWIPQGRIIWGDQLLAIYASEVLKTHPGATIIGEVKSSQVLYDEIARLGGKPLMWKTGHSLIKAKMAETKSPLAGEMSGHIFFGDKWYGFDDALYCAVRLISLVSRSGMTLAQILDKLPTVFNTPETRFEVDETRKFAIIEEVKAAIWRKSRITGQRYRWRARHDARWLVAGARIKHAERAGRPRRSIDARKSWKS